MLTPQLTTVVDLKWAKKMQRLSNHLVLIDSKYKTSGPHFNQPFDPVFQILQRLQPLDLGKSPRTLLSYSSIDKMPSKIMEHIEEEDVEESYDHKKSKLPLFSLKTESPKIAVLLKSNSARREEISINE